MDPELNSAPASDAAPAVESTPAVSSGFSDSAPAPVSQPAFYESVRDFGPEFASVADDASAQSLLADRYRAREQEYAQQQRDYQNAVSYYQQMAQRQAQAPPQQHIGQTPQNPTEAAREKRWKFNKIELDANQLRPFVRGKQANGDVDWAPNTPGELIQKYHDYTRQQADVERKFYQDPQEFLKPMMEDFLDEAFESRYQQRRQAEQQQQLVQNWSAQNPWAFMGNPNGGYVTDPQSGRPVLSSLGQNHISIIGQIQKAASDPALAMQLASQIHALQLINSPQQQMQAPTQQMPAAQPQATPPNPVLRRHATHTPGITPQPAGRLQTPRLSEMLFADAAAGR